MHKFLVVFVIQELTVVPGAKGRETKQVNVERRCWCRACWRSREMLPSLRMHRAAQVTRSRLMVIPPVFSLDSGTARGGK
jgi:hypothetical protein